MTFDGVSSVQARIAQIQDLISATVAGASPQGGAANASSTSSSSGSSSSASQFATLLQDAMAAGSLGGSDPLADPSTGALGGSGTSSSGVSGVLSQLTQLLQQQQLGQLAGTAPATSSSTSASAIAQRFLSEALAQQGKPYVYGTTNVADPNPKSFDCEGLVKWAAAQVGVSMPSGATAQYVYIRDHGGTMSVQQALHTPGALLFHFSHEPRNAGDVPADGHVAISVGDGVHTMEARGHNYGVNEFANAGGRSFNYAGMIPGM
jgi:cell wall-associated NlpC family hydrolase